MSHQHNNPRVYARLIVIMFLFLVGAWLQGWVMPVLEGGDEWLQLAYVEHLRSTGTLPDRSLNRTGPVRQQSGQPPLTYAISALPPLLLRLPVIDTWTMMDELQADSNNWFAPPDRFNRLDNNNVFYLSNPPAQNPEVVAVNRAVRWIAPVYGIITLLIVFGIGRDVLNDDGWALAAVALFAFMPTFLHMNSFLTTDAGAALFGTLLIWLALNIVKRGPGPRLSLLTGLALGLGGLAKVSTLLLAPVVGLALIMSAWRNHPPRRAVNVVILHGLLMSVPLMLTFGVWVGWGWSAYGDPLGTNTHRFPGQFYDPPLPITEVIQRLPEVYISYWGKFASAVYLHPVTYGVLSLLPLLALIGWGVSKRRWPANQVQRQQAMILILSAVLVFAGLYYWVATINFITGRLMFPVQVVVVLGITAGFRALARPMPSGTLWLRAALVVPVAVSGLIFTPLALWMAYTPPRDLTGAPMLSTLERRVVDYDGQMRFIGWQSTDGSIHSGELYQIDLCWQVLQPATRPAAYSLKVVKDGITAGERTTVHGLGRYDWRQWQGGHTFCDALDVPISSAEPGITYDLLLVMLDAQTGAVDWQATTEDGTPIQFPIIGQVTAR